MEKLIANDTRYILAAPKEDVEMALEALEDVCLTLRAALCECIAGSCKCNWDNIETIRRVLLANAGRKE